MEMNWKWYAFGCVRVFQDGWTRRTSGADWVRSLHATTAHNSCRRISKRQSQRAREPHFFDGDPMCACDGFDMFWSALAAATLLGTCSCCRSRAKCHSRGQALGRWWLYWVSFGGRVRARGLDVEAVLAIAGMVRCACSTPQDVPCSSLFTPEAQCWSARDEADSTAQAGNQYLQLRAIWVAQLTVVGVLFSNV